MFNEHQKEEEQHGINRCDFQSTTHRDLNRKRAEIYREGESGRSGSCVSWELLQYHLHYNNIGTFIQSYQVGRYEWTNGVTPERTHRWNCTDGWQLEAAAAPLSDRRQPDRCSSIGSFHIWNIRQGGVLSAGFRPEWMEILHQCGSILNSDCVLGPVWGCWCLPSLFLEVTESAVWPTCPPQVTYVRHPSCPAQVRAKCINQKVQFEPFFIYYFRFKRQLVAYLCMCQKNTVQENKH